MTDLRAWWEFIINYSSLYPNFFPNCFSRVELQKDTAAAKKKEESSSSEEESSEGEEEDKKEKPKVPEKKVISLFTFAYLLQNTDALPTQPSIPPGSDGSRPPQLGAQCSKVFVVF